MKNKGFTLVEILAVIAIIAIIVVIAATGIFNSSDKMKEKSLNSKTDMIEKSTLIYVQNNANSLKNEYSDSKKCISQDDCYYEFYMTVDKLIEIGAYESEKKSSSADKPCDVENPVDGSCLDNGEVRVRLDDNHKTAEIEFILPSSNNLIINSGDVYTNTRNVKLSLSAPNASQMCISNSASSCTSYVKYAQKYNWTLTSGDGKKTVYVWFKDANGNTTSTPANDTITLDTAPPTNGTVQINANGTYTNNRNVTLNLSATNATKMCISNSASSCTSYIDYKTSSSWTLGSTNGTQRVYVWFKDIAGNVTSSAVSDSIILDTSAPVIKANATSYTYTYKASNNVNNFYTVTYGPSGGSASCKVGSTVVTNTNTLGIGNHSLVCTANSNAGKSASTTINLLIQAAEMTINFNSASDLNYFNLTTNSRASVAVTGGYLKESSSVLDNSINVVLTPEKVNMTDFSYVEFKMRKTATRSGVFPHLRVWFADGKRFHYILMNNFIWSGYMSWYGQALYRYGNYSMWAFGNNGSLCYQPNECSDQTTGVYGTVCYAYAHTTESVYSVTFDKSTGKFTIYNGYCGTTVTTSALTKSKVTRIDFNFQDDWFNNNHTSMIDYIKVKQ